jgi:O-antigen/teichoic acid export membrane protein
LDYSLPLIPYGICTVVLAQIDRIVINKYSGPTDVGLFSLAYNIGSLLTLILSALSQAWTPAYYRLMKEGNHIQLNNEFILIMKILMASAYLLILFGQEIGLILAKSNFHSALFIVPIIVIGLIFYSYSTFYSWHVQYVKKNIYMTPIVVVAGLANVVINLLFIPKYGYVAAAFASSISYFVMLIMSIVITNKVLKIRTTPILQAGKPFFIMIPFIVLFYALAFCNFSLIVNILLKSCLFIAFVSIIFYSYIETIYLTRSNLQTSSTL